MIIEQTVNPAHRLQLRVDPGHRVVITMANGTRYEIEEVASRIEPMSKSRCQLRVRSLDAGLIIEPGAANTILMEPIR